MQRQQQQSQEQQIKQELYSKLTNEELYYYVLNEKNKIIPQEKIDMLFKTYNIDYKIKDLKLFQLAFVHESYLKRDFKIDKTLRLVLTKDKIENIGRNLVVDPALITLNKEVEPITKEIIKKNKILELKTESYERIEFLGDSVIRLVMTEYLFKRYEDQQEGFLTRLRTKMENGETLAKISLKLGFGEYVIIGRYYETLNARTENHHILEDLMEGFVGALYLDGGYDICNKFIVNLIEKELDIAEYLHVENNFKDMLLQYYHKLKLNDPLYEMIQQNLTEKRVFKMCVKDETGIKGIGIGTTKKKAEQQAAQNALIAYGVIKDEVSDDEIIYD